MIVGRRLVITPLTAQATLACRESHHDGPVAVAPEAARRDPAVGANAQVFRWRCPNMSSGPAISYASRAWSEWQILVAPVTNPAPTHPVRSAARSRPRAA